MTRQSTLESSHRDPDSEPLASERTMKRKVDDMRSGVQIQTESIAEERTRTLLIAAPIVVLFAGIAVLAGLIATKPEPEKKPAEEIGLLVSTTKPNAGTHQAFVRARGRVVPSQSVSLSPQVAGRVVWQSDKLVPGGTFKKGESLFRVDQRDYKLALEARAAEVNRAQLELEVERGRQKVAQKEWRSFGDKNAGEQSLALRQPHLQTATVGVKAASSSMKKARLDLRRTNVVAPFSGTVMSENIDLGQLVAPGGALGTFVGTEEFWVQVSVPVSSLSNIQIDAENGSTAKVWQVVDGKRIERPGRVIRMLPELAPGGTMARVLVSIANPLGDAGRLPLLLNSFVTVDIDVDAIENAVAIPRLALREGRFVYLKKNQQLEIREVDVLWSTDDTVLLEPQSIEGGDVIISRIPTPVQGMAVRTKAANKTAADGEKPGGSKEPRAKPAANNHDKANSMANGSSKESK